jgi:hypothetical protein
MSKTILALAIGILAVSIGDILLSRGMKEIGAITSYAPLALLKVGAKVFSHPTILIGIVCLSIFFFLWLAVLSWAELSFVLPLTASSYIVTAILAFYFLGETITPLRWAGTLFICIGVAMVTKSGG